MKHQDHRLCSGARSGVTEGPPGSIQADLRSRRYAPTAAFTAVSWFAATIALAAPSVEDVFKSVGDNVNRTADPSRVLALFLGAVGVVLILALLSQRKKRQVAPKAMNHQGKLLREVCRTVNLRPAQLKKLKIVADAYAQNRGEELQSPLTLLLCPSVLAEAMKRQKQN